MTAPHPSDNSRGLNDPKATGTELGNQRHLFNIPDEVAYFNCAYMSPALNAAAAAGKAAVVRKQQPWTITAQDFFSQPDQARALFARLIGAKAQDIAIVPSVSYGIAAAAMNISVVPGQEIVVVQDQFPSNVYSWMETARGAQASLVTVARTAADASDEADTLTQRILTAIGPRTALVALPHCHWVDGAVIDLVAIGHAVREVGAALVLDITQSAGVMALDVQQVKPDFLVAAAYKWLLGPYSLGFLYVAPGRQQGQPLEQAWTNRMGAEDFSSLVNYQERFAPGAKRFDMGESAQFHLLPMAVAALEQILEWGVDRVARTLAYKTRAIAGRTANLGLVASPESLRAPHYLGLQFPAGMPPRVHQELAERGVFVSIRGDRMRVTPHLYNTEADTDRLVEALHEVL